jgi:hypothetical protein
MKLSPTEIAEYAATIAEQINISDVILCLRLNKAGTNHSSKNVKNVALSSKKFADVHSQ